MRIGTGEYDPLTPPSHLDQAGDQIFVIETKPMDSAHTFQGGFMGLRICHPLWSDRQTFGRMRISPTITFSTAPIQL